MIKVVILGGGNLGRHLAHAFLQSDQVEVAQMYNRSISNIQLFEEFTSVTDDLSNLKDADIYIISVSDDVIDQISSRIHAINKLVVHTSGAMRLNSLKSNSGKGVFYPLQTFSKNKTPDFDEIPFCLEADSDHHLKLLTKLAASISKKVYHINSHQRKQLHIAAVFVNNFTNHCFTIGEEICKKANLPFDILKPLIFETSEKLKLMSPADAQTGPAIRNDIKTIKSHNKSLSDAHKEVYDSLTNAIQEHYGKKL